MRKFDILVLLAATMLCGVPCLAATPVSAAKTKEFHEAYAAFTANDPTKAYEILAALVAQTPAYDAIGLLGQTELSLGMYRDAAEHLTFAINNTPSGKAADALPVLKDDLIETKTQIATLRVTVDQPDADVAIDGKVVGKSPLNTEVFVDPGKHTIKAKHPTLGSAEASIDTKKGEDSAIALKLAQLSAANTPEALPVPALKYTPADLDKPSNMATSSPPAVEPHRGIEGRTIVLIAGGAVTLIAAGSATYFGLKSRSLGKDAESRSANIGSSYGNNSCVSPTGGASNACADLRNKRNDQRDAGRNANISSAAAGVAAVATGLTYMLWPRSKGSRTALVMAPTVAPGTGGLILQGNF